jgi:hypothetical protein
MRASLRKLGDQDAWSIAGIDWSAGGGLQPDAAWALAAFASSPLARHGAGIWDAFRREFQGWMACQFLHGEQGALEATRRLEMLLPDADARAYAGVQVADEARHVEAFARYVRERVPEPYALSPPLGRLLDGALRERRWDFVVLGMQVIVESLALSAFRLASGTFADPLLQQISALVARDETRHVSFGVLLLRDAYRDLSASARAEREEFVLEAAELTSRRFLFGDIWQRLGVDVVEGEAFAAGNPTMVAWRQAVFAKVVTSVARIGLAGPGLRDGLERLGLLSAAGRRALTGSMRQPATSQ